MTVGTLRRRRPQRRWYAALLGLGILSGPIGAYAQTGAPSAVGATPDLEANCAYLAHDMAGKWPDQSTHIESSKVIPAGPLPMFAPPMGPPGPPPTVNAPAHCDIQALMHERTGTDGQKYAVRFHLRMPLQWNGRFFFQGGGGLDGEVGDAIGAMPGGGAPALLRGYAVVSENGGHDNSLDSSPTRNGMAAFGFDAKARTDYGYASLQPVAQAAKALLAQFYGHASQYSYFVGCSKGGQEGLAFAERYPQEFNGIVAASPALSLPRAALAQAWDAQSFATLVRSPAEKSVPMGRLAAAFSDHDLELVRDAVLAACDADDGLKDGMVNDFMHCTSDRVRPQLAARTCKADKQADCLSAAQVTALQRSMAGPRDERDTVLYSDWPWDAGIASLGWRIWKIGSADGRIPPLSVMIGGPALSAVFTTPPTALPADPQSMTDYVLGFDFNRAAAGIYAHDGTFSQSAWDEMSARSADLRAFEAHGGKLIVPQGVSDPVFSIFDTLSWYREVQQRSGGAPQRFARVFAVPGMNHCLGGPATDNFDALQALVDWVEQGKAPDRILASAGPMSPWPGRTRPLCPFPRHTHYIGHGDAADAANFECRE
jgi:hypothetical protein